MDYIPCSNKAPGSILVQIIVNPDSLLFKMMVNLRLSDGACDV
jgi:hypothetical protein